MLTLVVADLACCPDERLARAIAVWLVGYGWSVTVCGAGEAPLGTTWAPDGAGAAHLDILIDTSGEAKDT